MKITTTPANIPLLQNDNNQKETWKIFLNTNINFCAKIQFEFILNYFAKYFNIYYLLIDWSNMKKQSDEVKKVRLNFNQSKKNEYIFYLSSIVSIYRSILMLNLMISLIPPSANAVSAGNDAFSIDKLMEYTELVRKTNIFLILIISFILKVTCFGQMSKEFEQCNRKGAEKAKSFLGQIELSNEWNKRLKCCGTWKLRDCWMKAAKQKCTKIQSDMVYKLPELIMPALAEECAEYLPESGKCSLPIWFIVIVIATIIFILLTCCCSVIYCIRRCNKNNKYRRKGMPPPNQRPYSLTKSYQNGVAIKMNGLSHSYHHKNYQHTNHQSHYYTKSNHYEKSNHKAKESSLDNVDAEEIATLTSTNIADNGQTRIEDTLTDEETVNTIALV